MSKVNMNSVVSPECENKNNSGQCSNTSAMNLLRGYEDLGVTPLGNASVAKRCRYLNPQSTIWPMGYGLVTALYKYKHRKPKIHINNFERLPEEVVLHIFKMLDKRTLTKCAYVCNQWRRISYDESLWKCLNIPDRRMSDMALDCLLRRNIKFLSISHSNIYDTRYTFETPFSKLLYLDLSAVFISVETLKSLLSQCRNLVKLSLENCEVDHLCCENIGRNTQLKVLNMASTSGLEKIGLKHILSLKNLEELNISWVVMMKDDDLRYLITNMMPSMKRLNISGYLMQLADCDLISLVYRCPQLIELDVSDSLSITKDSMDFVLYNQPNLNVLSLNRCYNIGSAFLRPNALKFKLNNCIHRLKELNLFGMAHHLSNSLSVNNTLEISINKTMYSGVARPKLADNEYTIWEITIFIDC